MLYVIYMTNLNVCWDGSVLGSVTNKVIPEEISQHGGSEKQVSLKQTVLVSQH